MHTLDDISLINIKVYCIKDTNAYFFLFNPILKKYVLIQIRHLVKLAEHKSLVHSNLSLVL